MPCETEGDAHYEHEAMGVEHDGVVRVRGGLHDGRELLLVTDPTTASHAIKSRAPTPSD